MLEGLAFEPGPGFSFEAQRLVEPFAPLVFAALRQAGLEPETFLPEYGRAVRDPLLPGAGPRRRRPGRCDAGGGPRGGAHPGLPGELHPDGCPGGVGSGVHIHMSPWTRRDDRRSTTPDRPGRMSLLAARFAAGILEHLPALCAFTAPSVVSYLRLGPHHWSAAFGTMSERDREATIRIPPLVELSGGDPAPVQPRVPRRRRRGLPAPRARRARPGRRARHPRGAPRATPDGGDVSELDDEERRRLGVKTLPASLEEALRALEADEVVRSWVPDDLLECHIGVKRTEISLLQGLSLEEACERYLSVY